MAHPSEGMLQAFIDGELAADERVRVGAHLEQCAACRAELEQLEAAAASFATAVGLFDTRPDLAIARRAIQERHAATHGARRILRILPREPARATAVRRALLRAAVLVLLAAGAVSAAVPGSPVRRFFVNLWQQTSRLFIASRPAPPTAAPAARAPAPEPAPALPTGVSVLPLQGQVVVQVHAPAPGLRVHVRLVDSDRASVEASGPASAASFKAAPGRIEVSGGGPGELVVGIPRTASHADVDVDGKPLFTKDGPRIRRMAPTESTSTESVFEVPR